MDAVDRAVARVEATADEHNRLVAIRRAREDADPRLTFLRAALASLPDRPMTYGIAGCALVFDNVFASPDLMQRKRIGSLAAARQAQLGGFHAGAKAMLARAASFNRERARRLVSTLPATQTEAA